MNRVHVDYGEYGRLATIREVIYQTGQFDCARETIRGKYNAQNIYNMSVEDIHYDIAEWAIAGNRLTNLGFALWYFNPFSPSCRPNFPSNVGEFVAVSYTHLHGLQPPPLRRGRSQAPLVRRWAGQR